jgi:hypothetical protein
VPRAAEFADAESGGEVTAAVRMNPAFGKVTHMWVSRSGVGRAFESLVEKLVVFREIESTEKKRNKGEHRQPPKTGSDLPFRRS